MKSKRCCTRSSFAEKEKGKKKERKRDTQHVVGSQGAGKTSQSGSGHPTPCRVTGCLRNGLYSRYDNETPGAKVATRREEAADHRRRRRRRRRDGATRDPDRNTPTRIPPLPFLIYPRANAAERRDARRRRPVASAAPRKHLTDDRAQIMTAAVVMENVNWDPGKCCGHRTKKFHRTISGIAEAASRIIFTCYISL